MWSYPNIISSNKELLIYIVHTEYFVVFFFVVTTLDTTFLMVLHSRRLNELHICQVFVQMVVVLCNSKDRSKLKAVVAAWPGGKRREVLIICVMVLTYFVRCYVETNNL